MFRFGQLPDAPFGDRGSPDRQKEQPSCYHTHTQETRYPNRASDNLSLDEAGPTEAEDPPEPTPPSLWTEATRPAYTVEERPMPSARLGARIEGSHEVVGAAGFLGLEQLSRAFAEASMVRE